MTDVARFAAEPAITTSTYTRVSPYLGIITPTTQSMITDKKDTQAGLVDGLSPLNSSEPVITSSAIQQDQSSRLLLGSQNPNQGSLQTSNHTALQRPLKNESQIQPGRRNTSSSRHRKDLRLSAGLRTTSESGVYYSSCWPTASHCDIGDEESELNIQYGIWATAKADVESSTRRFPAVSTLEKSSTEPRTKATTFEAPKDQPTCLIRYASEHRAYLMVISLIGEDPAKGAKGVGDILSNGKGGMSLSSLLVPRIL
ncbi:hypothetical protein B0H11DRAFT_1935603 [Mycena galericulata]|nr:hypothetical protein B0H11DRAFT_1935603 [Mycena galericulata]